MAASGHDSFVSSIFSLAFVRIIWDDEDVTSPFRAWITREGQTPAFDRA
jgi:hypothetical protein